MPRVSLHCQALEDKWLTEINPDDTQLSPWERSLALNGRYHINVDEQAMKERDTADIMANR